MATDPTPRVYNEPDRLISQPDREVLSHNTVYPIAYEDRSKARAGGVTEVRAVWTGQRRAPKRGEWYLSGSIIEAYQAPNDLTTVFAIAKLVRAEAVVRWVDVA